MGINPPLQPVLGTFWLDPFNQWSLMFIEVPLVAQFSHKSRPLIGPAHYLPYCGKFYTYFGTIGIWERVEIYRHSPLTMRR